jgi:protein-disulfide isomerase
MAKISTNFYDRVAPVLLILVVGLAFAVGVLWQKVSALSTSSVKTTTTSPGTTGNTGTVPQGPTTGKLSADQAAKVAKVTAEDHIRGGANPQVYLIEYSDYECPFCSQFHTTAQAAAAEYGNKMAWVYRHFPLDSIHPKARPAANASECIFELGGQDAFWRFTDEVFKNQAAKLADLSATAVTLGVNKANFDKCLSENRHDAIIEADYQTGLSAGVTGTPGNFIMNSKGEVWLLPGAVPLSTLKKSIDEALAS